MTKEISTAAITDTTKENLRLINNSAFVYFRKDKSTRFVLSLR